MLCLKREVRSDTFKLRSTKQDDRPRLAETQQLEELVKARTSKPLFSRPKKTVCASTCRDRIFLFHQISRTARQRARQWRIRRPRKKQKQSTQQRRDSDKFTTCSRGKCDRISAKHVRLQMKIDSDPCDFLNLTSLRGVLFTRRSPSQHASFSA